MPDHRRLTRRRFLRSAAAAAAAPYVLTSSALGADGGRPANDRINVCSVGVRNRGGGLLGHVLRSGDARLVAVCDVDREILDDRVAKADQHYGGKGVRGYTDYREVMARDDIDAIVLATPDHTHALIACAAMKAGKDVFVEKPMTLTIHEGRAMSDAARRYGRVVQVGSQRRSEGNFIRMAELVRNGRIGDVRTVHIGVKCGRPGGAQPWNIQPVPDHFDYEKWLGPAPWTPYDPARCHYNFRFVRDFSGGEMTNWGAHFFDVVQMVLGMDGSGPLEIKPVAGFRHPSGVYDVWKDFKLEFAYPGGIKVLCNMGPGMKFTGTEGWLSSANQGEPKSIFSSTIGPDEVHMPRPHGGHMGEFFHAVRTREPTTAPVEAGHRSATVCHLANLALDLDRTLRWDPVREEFPGDDEANRLVAKPYREPWHL